MPIHINYEGPERENDRVEYPDGELLIEPDPTEVNALANEYLKEQKELEDKNKAA